MNKDRLARFLSLILLALVTGSVTAAANRPNIIIFYTDDHGWADLSCQGSVDDIKTPHTDRLAAQGVRFTSGYSTAPQCRPARAGLMAGRYQNRFGLEHNGHNGFPWGEYTIAERLRDGGYITGMAGKWHLHGTVDSTGKLPDGSNASEKVIKAGIKGNLGSKDPGQVQHHGFMEHLSGSMNTYVATHSADGKDLGGVVTHVDRRYRVDVQAEWGANFINRHAKRDKPFFLYLPLFAPHVPLEAPKKYLDRFPRSTSSGQARSTSSGQAGEMPRRRQLALAMISSVDDGVGLITKTLEKHGISDNTLIFYMSDNGAPLKMHKIDAPGGGAGWDGSLNDPYIGEKGMLTEGGIRIPYIAKWPAKIPSGKVEDRPVISLDAVATSLVAAGLELDDRIDGVDLLPYLIGKKKGDPHEALYWRWAGQYAIRSGDWKLLKGGNRSYLFDVTTDEHESKNLIKKHPERAADLKKKLIAWSDEQYEPGYDHKVGYAGDRYFDFYLDGKHIPPPAGAMTPQATSAGNRNQQLFKSRDKNKDGFMTLEEFIGNPKGRNVPVLTKRFNEWDKNDDSKVTLKEMGE